MRMPRIPQNIQIRDSETLAIRGLNLTENFTDGDLEYVKNISTDHYPYFEPIRKDDPIEVHPEEHDEYSPSSGEWHVTDFTYWDGKMFYLAWATGDWPDMEDMYQIVTCVFDHNNVIQYTDYQYYTDPAEATDEYAGKRQFASIGNKMLIMPENIVIEKTEEGYSTYRSGKRGYYIDGWSFDGKTIHARSATAAADFHVGEYVTIEGGLNDGYASFITSIEEEILTMDKALTNGTESDAQALLSVNGVPDFDFICSHNNRIWGCSTVVENGFKKQMIYASALGNPYVYDDYSSLIGGWTTEVECDDDWTGCAALPSTVLFFKEKKILRVLGDDPSEFAVYTSNCEGVKKGCWKSLLNINDAIFYLGAHGVYIYSGSIPTRISERLGDRLYGDAVAGTDGIHYYLQMAEVDMDYARQTPYTLFVYNIMQGFWTANGESDEKFSFSQGNTLGVTYLKGGKLYMTNPANDSEGIEFEMILKPLYATITGSYNRQSQVFGMKRYLKTSVRMECGDEGTYILYCKFDDGDWEEIGRRLPETPTSKKSGVDYYAIPNNHCDKFQMRITGKGNVRLLGIQREYALAGRR